MPDTNKILNALLCKDLNKEKSETIFFIWYNYRITIAILNSFTCLRQVKLSTRSKLTWQLLANNLELLYIASSMQVDTTLLND
jgi:hypothetical protein